MSKTAAIRRIMSGEAKGFRAGLARAGLWVLSLGYGVAARAKNVAYSLGLKRATRVTRPSGLPLPIICVGNLTAGGTGKTPMVGLIIVELQKLGRTPGILSRGYGATGPSAAGGGSGSRMNDEARVLAELLPAVPHVQNPDRIAGARELAGLGVDVVVMDDGFSHRRIARDLDILLVDATCPFGHGFLLPRGLLREPACAAKRADIAIITRIDHASEEALGAIERRLIRYGIPKDRVLRSSHEPTSVHLVNADAASNTPQSPETLRGQQVFAICGLGNPDAFFGTLASLGAHVVGSFDFPDHFAYDDAWVAAEWQGLIRNAREAGAATIVVTQKDAVKLRGRISTPSDIELKELRVSMRIADAGLDTVRAELGRVLANSSSD